MPYVEWSIEGREFANCNCAWGCPCQFNALPTYGDCKAVCAYSIEKGHFGHTRLDGLNVVLIYDWPGPIHEGNGRMQAVIDQRADDAQADALIKVVHGEQTQPGTTAWAISIALLAAIEFEIDVDARQARLKVPELLDSRGEPVRNPVTGAEHRARIDLPNGIDFTFGETGSGSTRLDGVISLDFNDSFAVFANIHLTTHGIPKSS